jgi:putative NADPH-quinone reductase
MPKPERALLLVGSPRGAHSTSAVLGGYLLHHLAEAGLATETVLVPHITECEERLQEVLPKLAEADLLILSFPLYADTLPAVTTEFMEWVAASRGRLKHPQRQTFVAIANSGFPEAWRSHTALAICRKFAQEVGFRWGGQLALGGGAAIDGRPLSALGGLMRHAVSALDLTAAALAAGEPVPGEATELMARPFMPFWAYLCLGGLSWRRKTRRMGAWKILDKQPVRAAEKPAGQ